MGINPNISARMLVGEGVCKSEEIITGDGSSVFRSGDRYVGEDIYGNLTDMSNGGDVGDVGIDVWCCGVVGSGTYRLSFLFGFFLCELCTCLRSLCVFGCCNFLLTEV